jgi:cell division protein FtsQ
VPSVLQSAAVSNRASDSPSDRSSARDREAASREARRRRAAANRRVSFQRRAPIVAVAEGVGVLGRVLVSVARVLGKVLLVLGLVGLLFFGGKLALAHVMDSPRFALREVTVSPTARVSYDEVLALAGVEEGDRLLALDTDAIAARIAEHPWVAEARVSRQLPAGLKIDVTERKATAVALLGALYLLDDSGRPFKRATVAEADGLPVITGLERSQYVDHRQPSEAAYREALSIVAAWNAGPSRPPLGEVNLSPRYGFTAFLLDGGAEIRLGRGDYDRKLARLDQIFEAVEASGADGSAVRVVHLDGGNLSKISVGLQLPESPGVPAAGS